MFKEWCQKQGFSNANSLSHVLMDGGVLSIPFDRLDDFYNTCIECINNKEKIYVVEQKTELYNFFMDIDYKDEEALNVEEIKKISKIICDKVKSLGGKNCIISVALPKQVGNLIKTGIHYNWHGLVVDQEGALAIRDHVISTLKLIYGTHDWGDIVDVAVYGNMEKKTKGSGFRMPWSHKKGKHEECLGRGCDGCDNTGKITQLPYLPMFKYTHYPLPMIEDISQEPSVEILKLTTIRTECDLPTQIKALPKSKSHLIKEGNFTKNQTKNEINDSELQSYLQTFIRQHMQGQQDTYITKLFKHQKSYLISTTSRYCENLGREHNSNHVWFYINQNIIMQKCFCTCETNRGRINGFCKDFSGRKHILTDKIVSLLYTPEDDKKTKPQVIEKKINDETKELLENFINKHIHGQQNVQIVSLKKDRTKYIVETTATFCEKADQEHDDCIPFVIDKNGIIMANCNCKIKKYTPRGHILSSKIKDKLYPPKKK